MRLLSAFVLGLIFALGLGVGGMTQPTKVIGFLDVAGQWDATLAFVMGGAVTVSLVLFPLILKRSHPVLAERFFLPVKQRIDVPLVLGAALFGIGWGLSGYCPGPALVSLVTASRPVLVFVAFMAGGLYLGRRLVRVFEGLSGQQVAHHDSQTSSGLRAPGI
jgi:uncharacterized membrane protein YedE/YeeE